MVTLVAWAVLLLSVGSVLAPATVAEATSGPEPGAVTVMVVATGLPLVSEAIVGRVSTPVSVLYVAPSLGPPVKVMTLPLVLLPVVPFRARVLLLRPAGRVT